MWISWFVTSLYPAALLPARRGAFLDCRQKRLLPRQSRRFPFLSTWSLFTGISKLRRELKIRASKIWVVDRSSNQTISDYLSIYLTITSCVQDIDLKVPMCCAKCEEKVREELLDVEGVYSVVCDQHCQKVTVTGIIITSILCVCSRRWSASRKTPSSGPRILGLMTPNIMVQTPGHITLDTEMSTRPCHCRPELSSIHTTMILLADSILLPQLHQAEVIRIIKTRDLTTDLIVSWPE